MLAGVWFCLIRPLTASGVSEQTYNLVLSVAFAVVAMHPINLIGHYRFLSRRGRHKYIDEDRDYPWITDHEWVTLGLTALVIAYVVAQSPLFFGLVAGR